MSIFKKAQNTVAENLEAIKLNLTRCVEEGMLDTGDFFYNELLLLIDQTFLSREWEELEEVITRAKILEVDVAVFLANRGQTSLSLPWPTKT